MTDGTRRRDAGEGGGGGESGPASSTDRDEHHADGSTKPEVAARERAERRYSETYGRSAGRRFGAAEYPHAYGSPQRLDWRRALRAYVDGHDRGWEADRKYALAAEGDEGSEPAPRSRPSRRQAPSAEVDRSEEATARTGRGTRFGVEVAEPGEMTFHRSASTWRERLPRAPRMPRHTGRDLDGRRGRGNQA